MHAPSRKIIYLLIACVISVSLIYIAEKATSVPKNQIALETTSTPNTDQADEAWNNTFGQVATSSDETPSQIPIKPVADSSGSLTNTFAKDLFSRLVQTQNNNGVVDDQTNTTLSETILDDYSNSLNLKDHFTSSDIITSSTLDQDKVRQYANSFLTVEDQGLRAANALAKEDEASFVPMGNRYKQLASDLKILIVPDILSETHLSIMNNYYRLGEVLTQIPKVSSDPLKKLLLMQKVNDSQTERVQLYKNIAAFIKNSGIIFSNEEPGAYWVK